jgi:hypothetical protein
MQRPSQRPALVLLALSPISLVLAHNLVFLLSYGGAMNLVLRATGHDTAWIDAVRLVIGCTVALGVAGIARLAVLWRTARRLERETGRLIHPGWRGFSALLLRTWLGILLVTLVWFVVQENIERVAIGQAAPLLGVMVTGAPAGPIAVIPAISLLAAVVGTLFRWSASSLLARIAAARRRGRMHPRPVAMPRPVGRLAHPSSLLARHVGLRAPPRRLLA